ncbi:MAG TPA: MFS transporter [Tepiditoga sp.]|nr:MFS transporter [Tepiditoga sp.]
MQIFFFMLYTFISSIAQSMYRVIFNLYLRNNGFDNSFISHITSFEMIGSALLGIIIGLSGDKFGKKKMLIFTSVGVAAVLFLRVYFLNSTVIVYSSFFIGGFLSSRFMLLNAYLVDITKSSGRGKAFGYNFALFMGGGLFGNSLGGVFSDFFGFRNALIITAYLYIGSTIFLIFVKDSNKNKNIKLRELFTISDMTKTQKHVIKYFFIRSFFISFGAGLFVNFGNIIFKDLFDFSASYIGFALALAQLGASLGSVFSSKISKKIGPYRFTAYFAGIVIPIIFSLSFIRIPLLFTVFYALRFSFMNMTNPVIQTVTSSYMPKNRITTINSMRNFVNFSSRALAAFLFGIFSSFNNGYVIIFILSAVFYFFGLIAVKKLFDGINKDVLLRELY